MVGPPIEAFICARSGQRLPNGPSKRGDSFSARPVLKLIQLGVVFAVQSELTQSRARLRALIFRRGAFTFNADCGWQADFIASWSWRTTLN